MMSGFLLFALSASASPCDTGCGATQGYDQVFSIFPDVTCNNGGVFQDSTSFDNDGGLASLCPSPSTPTGYFKQFYTPQVFDKWSPWVIFPPLSVGTANYLRDGPTLSKYRKCVARRSKCRLDFKDPFVVCTRRSRCCTLTRSQFIAAVVATIKIVAGDSNLNISDRTIVVIRNIYDSAVNADANVEQLVNFTAIALHNVYLFTYFPSPDVYNVSIGSVTRGLLQLKSLNAYENITSLGRINYLERPYLLNTFSNTTIQDEFETFLRFYSGQQCGLESFISSVHLLESEEAPLVNQMSATEVLLGIYVPINELQARVLRRFNIYYVLFAQIFANATGTGSGSSNVIPIRSY